MLCTYCMHPIHFFFPSLVFSSILGGRIHVPILCKRRLSLITCLKSVFVGLNWNPGFVQLQSSCSARKHPQFFLL